MIVVLKISEKMSLANSASGLSSFAKNSTIKRYSELALSIKVKLKLLNNASYGYPYYNLEIVNKHENIIDYKTVEYTPYFTFVFGDMN